MQKIYPSLPTLASQHQTERWCSLIRFALGSAPLKPIDVPYGDRGTTILSLQCVVDVEMTIDIGDFGLPELPAPASRGSNIAVATWLILAQAMRRDAMATATLTAAISQLSPTALSATRDDNPEPWWQQELIILHALHSFALRQKDPKLLEKTLAAATFHLAEIQPDHATNEPWAIHAYASHIDGNVTAETLLHAAYMNGGGVLSDTSRWILAEALGALEAFARA